MERRQIDGRGLACPRPVILAKRALRELTAGLVEVTVDNEIAVQNLAKMAQQMGLSWSSQESTDNAFVVSIIVGDVSAPEEPANTADAAPEPEASPGSGPLIVVLAADTMGSGDPKLGRALMKSFIYTLAENDRLPDQILLYNSGVRLATIGSDAVQDLEALVGRGVSVASCGACLSFYELTEHLAVGSVTNMYAIAETLLGAGNIIRP